MRILFVTHYSTLYGANLSLLNMMIDLQKRYGVECAVFGNCAGAMADACHDNGIRVITCPYDISWFMDKTYPSSKRVVLQI